MYIRLCFVAFMLVQTHPLFARVDRNYFRSLPEDAQYRFADAYFINHWWDYYDARKKKEAVADYELMRSEAKTPAMTCLFKLFWHRNQTILGRWSDNGEATLKDLASIIEYARSHNLSIEASICQLEWCIAVLDHKGKMTGRTRRILIYDAALQAVANLKKQPLAALHPFHGAVYDIDHHLWWMSIYFFRIEEYELAREIAVLGEKVVHPELSTKPGHAYGYEFYKWQFLNDLGSCNLRMGRLAEAALWYRKAYRFGLSYGSVVHSSVSYGNMGVVLSRQGRHAEAIPYLQRAVQGARQGNDRQSEFNAMLPLADVYLNLRQYERAYPALLRTVVLYDSVRAKVGETDSVDIIPVFAGLGEVYQHRGDLKKALFYSQLANRLVKKKQKLDDSRLYRQKQERFEAGNYQTYLKQMDADRERAAWLRNLFVAGLVLVLSISLWYMRRQQKQMLSAGAAFSGPEQQAPEQPEPLSRRHDPEQAETPEPESGTDSTLPPYEQLLAMGILTEADWNRFQQLFEQVHPKFLLRLRRQYPTLTPAEIRIICLSRLSLSTKEMADMLGISADTVFKTRYRIRKKINLPEGVDISEAFARI